MDPQPETLPNLVVTNNNITINGQVVANSVAVKQHQHHTRQKSEHFIELQRHQTEAPSTYITTAKDELEEAVQKVVNSKEGLSDNTAGVIIFQDQNGIAPPITIEILKTPPADEGQRCTPSPPLAPSPAPESNNNSSSNGFIKRFSQEFRNSIRLSVNQGSSPGGLSTGSSGDQASLIDAKEQKGEEEVDPIGDDSFMAGKLASVQLELKDCYIGSDVEEGGVSSKGSMDKNGAHAKVAPSQLSRKQLQGIVERKREEREKQFEQVKAHAKKFESEAAVIVKLDWDTLVQQLQSRKLKAVQVLRAYQLKAVESTAFCNAVTEFNSKAMEIAERLDERDTVKGPLHGVPFCVKDDTNVQGMDSTLGAAKNCFKPAGSNSVLVEALVQLGAVPFCKTNVPQTLLTYAGDNPVFGATTSAHNDKLTPGGSSSGTGALVGSGGAMFGTGTDVGGSLRLPAHCNGIASLKPTCGRFSLRGCPAVLPNLVGLQATSGIMAANAKVVTEVTREILKEGLQPQLDPLTLPIPWNDKLYNLKRPLRIGYFTSLPFFPPVGDTCQVVESAVEALRAQGHTVIPVEMPDGQKVMRVAANFILADESKSVRKYLANESVVKSAELNNLASKAPMWAIRFFKFLMQRKTLLPFLYSDTLASLLDAGAFKSHQLWDNYGQLKELREEVFQTFTSLQLDCMVSPVMPFPAPPVNVPGFLPVGAVYTMMWNVIDCPAGVVKFGVETGKNIEAYETRGDQALILAQTACRESIGSPIGVQVISMPHKDELVLKVMEQLESCRS